MSEQVRLSFRKWDVEGTGVILKNELAYLLRFLDPKTTDGELNAIFAAAQINHEDTINYERFVTWLFCEIPDVFGKLSITDFNKAVESKSLWEVALSSAIADAAEHYPKTKVDAYFSDVRARVVSAVFSEKARRCFFERFGSGNQQKSRFEEVAALLDEVVLCSADMAFVARPPLNDVRVAFDAHDAKAGGRGYLEAEVFVSLVRYIQVQVALATFLAAEGRIVQGLKQLQSNQALREQGLWTVAMSSAKAKSCQRFDEAAVNQYFEEVQARLTNTAYAEHVKGPLLAQVDVNKDGKVSFPEALGLIKSTLQCAADLSGAQKPTPEAIREVFDAHDTVVQGWDFMGGDEFLNLMRYLQVQVAEGMLPLSQLVKKDS